MKTRLPLARAEAWAYPWTERLLLCGAVLRVLVAGSVRRCKPTVGDIEVVCVPHVGPAEEPGDLLGPLIVERDHLLHELDRQITAGDLVPGPRMGPRMRQYSIAALDGAQLDLFIVRPPAQWGVIAAIRTGPADYSQWLVTRARTRGLYVQDGALRRAGPGSVSMCEEEAYFFAALGLAMPEPRRRVAP
ncbi:MAG: hypothetical protein AMXMBFR64_04820 [Myxococcales bacterium]